MNEHSKTLDIQPKGVGTPIADLVIEDLLERKEFGIKKYGEPLKAFNGRKALVDLYQELIDAVLYTKQILIEEELNQI